MKIFLKNSGIIILLIGVLFLVIPFFAKLENNSTLLIGWILIIVGFIGYIIINKKIH